MITTRRHEAAHAGRTIGLQIAVLVLVVLAWASMRYDLDRPTMLLVALSTALLLGTGCEHQACSHWDRNAS